MKIACYQKHYRQECNRKAEHVDPEKPPENPWGTPAALTRVRQLNCVKLHCQDLLGDNPERLFLGKLRLGSMPSLSFGPLVA